MRKVVYKFFSVWNLDKEETWLNQMAADGWALIRVGVCKYFFEQCRPNEFVIRSNYLNGKQTKGKFEYIRNMQAKGGEYVDSRGNVLYFRSKNNTSFTLRETSAEQIEYYTTIMRQLFCSFLTFCLVFISSLFRILTVYPFRYDTDHIFFWCSIVLMVLCGVFGGFVLCNYVRLRRKRKTYMNVK